MLFKECLQNGIKIVRNNYDTIIWLKLDKTFFSFDEDVYLCGVYMWGENSPISRISDVDLFQTLQNDISFYEKVGTVVIAGDFNGRVSNKLDYVAYDNRVHDIDSFDYNPDEPLPRASIDKVSNAQGAQLLDLCKSTSMKIGNGRLDDGQSFTYYSRTGASVIDYILLKYETFNLVSNFKIMGFNEFSDHAPLQFSLHASLKTEDDINLSSNSSYKYKWNDGQKDNFRRNLITRLPDINNIFNGINRREKKSVNDAICDFVKVIDEVASPFFKRQMNFDSKGTLGANRTTRAKWFDDECREKKIVYINALNTFNIDKSILNRQYLCDKRKEYKNLIRRKRRKYHFTEMKKIESLRHKRPRDFWRLFKTSKSIKGKDLSVDDFYSYFKNLLNEINTVNNDESEDFCSSHNFDQSDPIFEELDSQITTDEVKKCINALSGGKACGTDNLLNEYFIEAGDILLSHITDLFNILLDSGYFPDGWTEGIIIPLFKKGNENDVNNFRGITLVSCLSKVFTAVLNNRINNWCEKYSKISDAQFGFRKGFSTVDAVFTLHSLIDHMLNNGKRLYCAFVDLKKAFDSVYRNALWLKLYKLGINGKMLRIIRALYDSVKCCIRHCDSYSDFFEVSVGLKQGETLSPILFSLFVEDLEIYLQSRPDSGLCINDINIMLLMFADDMVIIGDSPEELQLSLNNLHDYCSKWGLEVNTVKTKIVVFRKRGRLYANENWTYNGTELEVVNDFNYLGVVFNYTGSFAMNQQTLSGKALKAINILLQNVRRYDFSPRTLCQLFDSFVASILNYCSEVWGYTKSKPIERIHLKYCKKILNVKLSTSNAGIYGELARYPLYISRYLRILKYWFKLLHTDNCILKTVLEVTKMDCYMGKKNWLYNIMELLNTYGYGYLWDNPLSVSPDNFCKTFKQRLLDNFIQEWTADLETNQVLTLYKNFKNTFEHEDYLTVSKCKKYRNALARLRLSSHSLRIESGRYGPVRINRNERICQFCSKGDIEDEYHFVLVCTMYDELRTKYISSYYRRNPSVFKFIQLMNSDHTRTINNLSYFVYNAFKVRNSRLHNV